MRNSVASRMFVAGGAGVALFAVNNFALTTTPTRLPGGTVLAATDMLVVGPRPLHVARFSTIATVSPCGVTSPRLPASSPPSRWRTSGWARGC
jgi:hypothetical protein